MAVRVAAPLLGVNVPYIYKALIRRRVTADSGINPLQARRPRKLSSDQELALGAHIHAHPGITPAPIQAWLLTKHGVELNTDATWNSAQCLGRSVKKKLCERPSRTGPTSQADASCSGLHSPSLTLEVWLSRRHQRQHHDGAALGLGAGGERCHDSLPFGNWKAMTFVAGPRLTGMTAPWVLDGTMNGDTFRTYVEQIVVPTLKRGMLWCSTICQRIRSPTYVRQSRRDRPGCSIGRLPPGYEPYRVGILRAQAAAVADASRHGR
jgi:transposase